VFTSPIKDALGDLPAVDLVVAYGVPAPGGEHEVAVAAVTLRAGHELSARELSRALASLERPQRPLLVRVVDEIPVTTWFRPLTGPLRADGIPEPGEETLAWYLDASGEQYRPLTQTARRRVVGSAARRAGGTDGGGPKREASRPSRA
jgi:putative long chain acyl-CoA synthase